MALTLVFQRAAVIWLIKYLFGSCYSGLPFYAVSFVGAYLESSYSAQFLPSGFAAPFFLLP